MLSKGTEMMLQAVATQLMNKVQIDQTQIDHYKALVENFFVSHGVLIESHNDLRGRLADIEQGIRELAANQEVSLEEKFTCQHCGAEHEFHREVKSNDGTSGETEQ